MARIPRDINAVLRRAERQVEEVNEAYRAALAGSDISDETTVLIKNLLENERSALDYLAVRIRRKFCAPPAKKAHIYFPVATTLAKFHDRMEASFPGLMSTSRDVWEYLERIQPYPQRGENPLRDLRTLVNLKKHVRLVRQERREIPFGRLAPGALDDVAFRKSDFGARPEDDAWIDFRFYRMRRSALWVLANIHLKVEEIVEDLCRLL